MSEELKVVPDNVNQDTPEYIESMVNKAEGTPQQPISQEPTPEEQKQEELLLGKFKTQEDLIKSYQELEKKLSQTKQPAKENNLKAEEQPKIQEINFEQAQNEFQENGSLSEETISNLEKSGLPKSYIDNYLAGLEALASRFEKSAYEIAGGEENYKKMTDWVSSNLSPDEIKAFNDGVGSDDKTALYHIKNMTARFNSETKEPSLNYGQTNTATSGARYESLAQMKADMKNPRYATDSAFRKEVEMKLSRSNIL